ncbi:MAG: acyl carrier protein phosphodiesterase [Gammaproteobacteria bacterium]|nr:acyl carrier protein phosphodiesterase [Gammaproteobacteria bacterium]
MHRSIDAFTDSNKIVLRSKSRLGTHGYLKGVIIDIAYDFLLLKHWSHYSKVNIECFIDTFYRKANVAIEKYPGNAQAFVKSVIDSDLLISYGTLKGLEVAFQRIDSRLSDRVIARETAVGYLPLLKREMPGLEQDFSQFFPLLVEHFKSKAGEPLKHHWLR